MMTLTVWLICYDTRESSSKKRMTTNQTILVAILAACQY